MAQFQGPPPDITSVVSVDQSLRVTWSNSPYNIPNEATLLYIDTDDNEMYSILLNLEEILKEEYSITTNLIIGHTYAVFFSVLATNGNTYNSNTESCLYATVPHQPSLVSVTVSQNDPTTANAKVIVSTVNVGSLTTKLVFRILREGYSVSSQQFTYTGTPGTEGTYILTGLVPDSSYIVSVQAQNSIGYSNVSNSKQFINNDSPPAPTLNLINSGADSSATLTFSGTAGTAGINSFNFYANGTYVFNLPYTVAANTGYSVTHTLTGLSNGIGYELKVAGVNSAGTGLFSNIQKAVPATRLIFSNVLVTFPDTTTIRVDWTSNISTFANTGITKIQLREGTNVIANITYQNTNASSHYIEYTRTLTAGANYVCQLVGDNGSQSSYTVVPSNLLPFWITSNPILYNVSGVPGAPANGLIVLNSSTGDATYNTAPGPVSNITYFTSISSDPNYGSITYNWTAAAPNGNLPITYILKLYTVDAGSRTQIKTETTTGLTFTFTALSISPAYSVEIIASNTMGEGTPVNYPSDTSKGIYILASVNPVTNLTAVQTGYTDPNFAGKLTWTYNGPGNGYIDASMNVYKVGTLAPLASITYNSSQSDYELALDLGIVEGATYNYVVNVVAKVADSSPPVTMTSINATTSVKTGLPPKISDILVSDSASGWKINFKVTNATSGDMIPNSILSIVMPNPIDGITTKSPVYNGYDVSMVPLNDPNGYMFERILGYTAISNDYVTITASNVYGCTVYNNRWGQP